MIYDVCEIIKKDSPQTSGYIYACERDNTYSVLTKYTVKILLNFFNGRNVDERCTKDDSFFNKPKFQMELKAHYNFDGHFWTRNGHQQ